MEGSRDPPPLMAASQLTNAGAGADGRPSTALAALLEEDSYCTDAGVCMCWGGGGGIGEGVGKCVWVRVWVGIGVGGCVYGCWCVGTGWLCVRVWVWVWV